MLLHLLQALKSKTSTALACLCVKHLELTERNIEIRSLCIIHAIAQWSLDPSGRKKFRKPVKHKTLFRRSGINFVRLARMDAGMKTESWRRKRLLIRPKRIRRRSIGVGYLRFAPKKDLSSQRVIRTESLREELSFKAIMC